MTDLELMYFLEEEGYEPDLENLLILKEGLENGEIEILSETSKAQRRRSINYIKNAEKNMMRKTEPYSNYQTMPNFDSDLDSDRYRLAKSTLIKHKEGREAAKIIAQKRDIERSDIRKDKKEKIVKSLSAQSNDYIKDGQSYKAAQKFHRESIKKDKELLDRIRKQQLLDRIRKQRKNR